jgi:hypothetical protein
MRKTARAATALFNGATVPTAPITSSRPPSRWRSALAIGLVITALALFGGNLGDNEAGKLALARQAIAPGWIPTDWYLNNSQGYQWLFQQLSGRIVILLGFVPGSLLVRLLGYGAWAWALAGLTVPLGLTPALGALAAALFSLQQGVVAAEWMVGSAEPKTFAYAAVLLAYAAWRERRWWRCGLYSGLACSFHLLVGSFAVVSLAGMALARLVPETRTRRELGWAGVGRWSAGAVLMGLPAGLAVAQKLLAPSVTATPHSSASLPSAGWIYVVLRNPHHLLPSSWSAGDWARIALLLGLFVLAAQAAGGWWPGRWRPRWQGRWQGPLQRNDPCQRASRDLALWVAMSWPLALLGLLASRLPAAPKHALLSLYPFRLADTLLMLGLWLLLAAVLARSVRCWGPGRKAQRRLQAALVVVVLLISLGGLARELPTAAADWPRQFVASPEQAELYAWIRGHTPRSALVLAPPSGFEDLSLQTGRPGFVQFKQIPTSALALQTWFERLTALAGGDRGVWQGPGGWQARDRLLAAYGALPPAALGRLADDQGASVLVTSSQHSGPEGWAPAYRNVRWTAWQQP